MSEALSRALARFETLPPLERVHVRLRALTCPLEAVALRVPRGRVLEVGCGHGLLSALLAEDPGRTVLGIDRDPHKIALASRVARPPRLVFSPEGTAAVGGGWDAVVVSDVLYLVPPEEWRPFLDACARALAPSGRLVLKEASTTPAWKHHKTVAQERLVTRVLGRTRGASVHFAPPARLAALLASLGLRVEVTELGRGYSTPHVLFAASRP